VVQEQEVREAKVQEKLELARTRRRRRLDVPPRFSLTARLGIKRRVDLAVIWDKIVRQVKATPMGLLVKAPGVAEVRRIGGTCRLFMEALLVGRVEGVISRGQWQPVAASGSQDTASGSKSRPVAASHAVIRVGGSTDY
jgi:hypothetical protein